MAETDRDTGGAAGRLYSHEELVAEIARRCHDGDIEEARYWVDRALAEGVIAGAVLQ